MDAPTYQWAYSDARGIPAAVRAALAVSDWGKASAADVRALAVATEFANASLSGSWKSGSFFGQEAIYIRPTFSGEKNERTAAQATLVRTWQLLAEQLGDDVSPPFVRKSESGSYTLGPDLPWFVVDGSGAPKPFTPKATNSDAGFPPLVIAAVAVMATVQAAAIAYVVYKTSEVIDRELSRRENTRAMLKLHAAAVALIDRHAESERQAGKVLPFNDGERSALDALGDSQRIVAGRKETPIGGQERGALSDLIPWAVAAVVALIALTSRN